MTNQILRIVFFHRFSFVFSIKSKKTKIEKRVILQFFDIDIVGVIGNYINVDYKDFIPNENIKINHYDIFRKFNVQTGCSGGNTSQYWVIKVTNDKNVASKVSTTFLQACSKKNKKS